MTLRGLWELTLRTPLVVSRRATRSDASWPKMRGLWELTLRTPIVVFGRVIRSGGLDIVVPKVNFTKKTLWESSEK